MNHKNQMLKKATYTSLILISILTCTMNGHSQQVNNPHNQNGRKWRLNDPFEQPVFIENNEGQFNGQLSSEYGTILYSTRINGAEIYFTPNGIVYRYEKYPKINGDADKEGIKKPEQPNVVIFSKEWEGANKNVSIEAEDEVSFYYTYGRADKHTTLAHAFRKLLYKNIYPGIDIEYSFHKGEKGLEYAIIVHPGGDLSQVKMLNADATDVKEDGAGNIIFKSNAGTFKEFAPAKVYYQGGEAGGVSAHFVLTDNEISFNAGSYNHSKTLVIDPWMKNPGFGFNYVYDLDYDNAGNVYGYGSFNPFQLAKVNSAGTLLWVYTASGLIGNYYGDVAVDKITGTSYISEGYSGSASVGVKVEKINTSGFLVATYPGTPGYSLEIWRMEFNMCNRTLIAGCGANNTYQACIIDTNMASLTPVNVLSSPTNWHDVCILAIAPAGDTAYMAIAERPGDPTFNNVLLRCPAATLSPTSYIVADGYSFVETHSMEYYGYSIGAANGMNGMAVSYNWVYMYDGQTLKKASKQTGTVASSLTVGSVPFKWGGLDVDGCDNVFIGKHDSIYVYNSSLAKVATIALPDTVYDVHLDENHKSVYSCGQKFIESDSIPVAVVNTGTFTKTVTPGSCGKSNGKASASFTLCGNPVGATYLWSNGATSQSVTGLSAGVYTVTATIGCDQQYSDTVNIANSASDSVKLVITQTNIKCYGDTDGTATVTASGGKPPYSYDWSPVAGTNATISNLSAGTYQVTVSDSVGCNSTTVTITQPTQLTATVVASNNPGCSGGNTGSIVVSASGGTPTYTYNWLPSGGSNDTAKNLSAGVYTVNITDSNGCPSTLIDTLIQPIVPIPAITGNHPVCQGSSLTLTASGGSSYKWNTGATTASITITPASSTTYSVQVSNGPCFADTSFNVVVLPLPTVTLKSSNTSICAGDSSTFTAGGGSSYLWSNGSTNATITVSPATTTTYTVTVNNGSCQKDTTVTVTINTKPIAVVTGNQAICSGSSVSLTASGGTRYEWIPPAGLNCDTCPSVIASPSVTTTYTVIALNGNCPDSATSTVTVFMPAAVGACCNDTIQMGDTVKLKAEGSSGITGYYWIPTTSCDTCSVTRAWPQFTTTYSVTMSDTNGCVRTDSVTIFVEGCSTAWIPNAFTPNGDFTNPVFAPKGVCIVSYTMYIFNRWGELLYQTNDSQPWNGTYKGNVVQEDTYVYKIIILDGFLKKHTYIGRVTVIR